MDSQGFELDYELPRRRWGVTPETCARRAGAYIDCKLFTLL